MKTFPKVTIVTITYNLIEAGREDTFRQCLESVHNQTYKNIEHIVFDGASTDGTQKLIQKYADKGWITTFSKADEGIYHALNNSLEMASGKYIAFLNSDDFYHDINGIEKSVEMLEKQNAVYSYANCRLIDKNDDEAGQYKAKIKKIYFQFPFVHQTMFCNTDILRKLGGFDTRYKSASDYDLMIKLALNKYKGIKVPLCFTTYRQGGFSTKNLELSMHECFLIYTDNYKKYLKATDKEIKDLYENKIISNKLMLNFLKKTRFENFIETLVAFLMTKVKSKA